MVANPAHDQLNKEDRKFPGGGEISANHQEATSTLSPNISKQGRSAATMDATATTREFQRLNNRFYIRTTRQTTRSRASSSIRAETNIFRPAVKTFYFECFYDRPPIFRRRRGGGGGGGGSNSSELPHPRRRRRKTGGSIVETFFRDGRRATKGLIA